MAVGDISGYDETKGVAQSAFAAVANALGLNNAPAPAATAPAATAEAARETPAAERSTTTPRADQPATEQRASDPAADSMRMYEQQRRMAMMGGGGDLLGNGGSGKAQVFGPAAPGKQQPSAPGPRGRG